MQAPAEGAKDLPTEPTSMKEVAVPLGSALLAAIALSVDELNPVKVLCGYAQGYVREYHVALLAALWLLVIVIDQRDRLLYNAVRIFFRCTLNNMFFSSVEIVGMENLPKDGPVILTGNHNNQFVDGVLLLTNTHREISFMIAQKSWDRPIVGFLARAFHCIPVARPQDLVKAGAGTVSLDGTAKVRGEGTRFTEQVQPGATLEVEGKSLKVKAVTSNTELTLEAPADFGKGKKGLSYKVTPKIDQTAMYETVYTGLKKGKCLGIFPEGGSHDRTDLLPLKAGIAIIALDAFSKHHIHVPIVPVGLNYFHGHRFGGRVVIEYGPPINIPERIYQQHETDRRGATEALLEMVAVAMRGVIVPAPDYHTLQQIYMVRRLYVPEGLRLTAEATMDLNRRFAVGTQKILHMVQQSTTQEAGTLHTVSSGAAVHDHKELLEVPGAEEPPVKPDELLVIEELRKEIDTYMASLKRLGFRDHQVRQLGWWSAADIIGRLLYLLVTMGLGAIPQLMFNLPVMIIAGRLAAAEQQKSLKSSTVKLAARDVVMSYKIIYVLVLVPCLYLIYAILLFCLSSWTTTSIILSLATLPFFAYLGMKASEEGVRVYTDIVPLFMRLLPDRRREQDALPARRAALKRRVRQVVKMFGPRLGDLYWGKDVDWTKEKSVLCRPASGLNLSGLRTGDMSPRVGAQEAEAAKQQESEPKEGKASSGSKKTK